MAAFRLAGFLVLLAAIFAGAHVIAGKVGPVSTGHSQIQYTGGSAGTSGTNSRLR